jgi:hypothetical protein
MARVNRGNDKYVRFVRAFVRQFVDKTTGFGKFALL